MVVLYAVPASPGFGTSIKVRASSAVLCYNQAAYVDGEGAK